MGEASAGDRLVPRPPRSWARRFWFVARGAGIGVLIVSVIADLASSPQTDAAKQRLATEASELRPPPTATLVREDVNSGLAFAQVTHFYASGAPSEEILAAYDDEMKVAGWVRGHETRSVYDVRSVCFSKGEDDAWLEVHPAESTDGRFSIAFDWSNSFLGGHRRCMP
jgi:hypothetical protein